MGIATRTGDDGTTGLGSGLRVPKDDPRIEALGAVDELSSLLGFARVAASRPGTAEALEGLQRTLFRVGGELASEEGAFRDPLRREDEAALTEAALALEAGARLDGFVLPGGSESSARIDLARVAARSLERRVAAMSRAHPVAPPLRGYLNRLSDYLFLLARAEDPPAAAPIR